MAEITWIKLKTDMFDNDKIKLIEALPDKDTIIVIWVKLLTAAGKSNKDGFIMLTEDIPMNIEEMATIFNRPLNTVRLAIQTFQRYGMIEVDENETVSIKNWDVHQNVDGMDRVRQLRNARNREYRKRKKEEKMLLGAPKESEKKRDDVSVTSRMTLSDGTDIDIDIDIDKDIKNIKPSCHRFSNVDLENAILLFALIREHHPKAKKPKFEKWADVFRLIREVDEQRDVTVKHIIRWVQRDEFWKINILSPAKLRKQWDQVYLKAKAEYEKQNKAKKQQATQKIDFDKLRERYQEDEQDGNSQPSSIGNAVFSKLENK